MTMAHLLARMLRDRSGSSAVEMALVTPIALAMMFGFAEMGNLFWQEHVVTKSVRDGARFAGRQPFAAFSCAAVTDSAVATAIKEVTRTGQPSGGAARISGWTNSQVSLAVSCSGSTTGGIYGAQAGGAPVITVTASFPYASLFGRGLFPNLNVNASAQAAVMGV